MCRRRSRLERPPHTSESVSRDRRIRPGWPSAPQPAARRGVPMRRRCGTARRGRARARERRVVAGVCAATAPGGTGSSLAEREKNTGFVFRYYNTTGAAAVSTLPAPSSHARAGASARRRPRTSGAAPEVRGPILTRGLPRGGGWWGGYLGTLPHAHHRHADGRILTPPRSMPSRRSPFLFCTMVR